MTGRNLFLDTEREPPALAAGGAAQPRKTAAEEPAFEICLQFLSGAFGDAHGQRSLVDRAVERLEILAHHLVEHGGLGPVAAVGSGCGGAVIERGDSGHGAAA